jgi:hypothetical protein
MLTLDGLEKLCTACGTGVGKQIRDYLVRLRHGVRDGDLSLAAQTIRNHDSINGVDTIMGHRVGSDQVYVAQRQSPDEAAFAKQVRIARMKERIRILEASAKRHEADAKRHEADVYRLHTDLVNAQWADMEESGILDDEIRAVLLDSKRTCLPALKLGGGFDRGARVIGNGSKTIEELCVEAGKPSTRTSEKARMGRLVIRRVEREGLSSHVCKRAGVFCNGKVRSVNAFSGRALDVARDVVYESLGVTV